MCDTENQSPYTHEEKVFVASLVEQHKYCLESKKTDANSLQAKGRAWEEITNNFNANFKHRTSKKLRKLWDNLEHRTRKSDTDFKYKTLETGGGPSPKEDDDPINEIVRSVVPTINLEVMNPFDSNKLDKIEESVNPPLPKRSKMEMAFQAKPELKSSTSASGTQQERKEGKNAINDSINEEVQLRLRRLREGIEQQAELHRMKMAVAEAEKTYWEERTKLL